VACIQAVLDEARKVHIPITEHRTHHSSQLTLPLWVDSSSGRWETPKTSDAPNIKGVPGSGRQWTEVAMMGSEPGLHGRGRDDCVGDRYGREQD
jgi:hypothetical protein